jgi:hypothetical protein
MSNHSEARLICAARDVFRPNTIAFAVLTNQCLLACRSGAISHHRNLGRQCPQPAEAPVCVDVSACCCGDCRSHVAHVSISED